jgi:hypothetical protein
MSSMANDDHKANGKVKKQLLARPFIKAVTMATKAIMHAKGKAKLTDQINAQVRGMFVDGITKKETFSRSQLQRWLQHDGKVQTTGRKPYLNRTDQKVLNVAIRRGSKLGLALVPRRVDEMVGWRS